jgi:2-polyprenyl-3-methyl-5-hydroxy-6-metoxy-1,4-benzoquinol methylase
MTAGKDKLAEGLLPYYTRHGISPVHYRVDSIEAHFDRRDSLYRSLGLPPLAFRNHRVLEVAAGSGQNSLYVASCLPQTYDLVEPNTAGIRDIRKTYEGYAGSHTPPTLHEVQFENYKPDEAYDVVICENWLGSMPQDLAAIGKLASLVKPGGVLVITSVPVSGFFANTMRKLLALRLTDPTLPFDQKTEYLVGIFSPHLATIGDMTRNHRDWVQDTMLLPAYLDIALSFDAVTRAVGADMEFLASFPRFAPDWRWFKGLVGDRRRFNEHMLTSFGVNLHNFIDHRTLWPTRAADDNARLETLFKSLHSTALALQATGAAHDRNATLAFVEEIGGYLSALARELGQIDQDMAAAVAELKSVWDHPAMDAAMVRDMRLFSSLFGRETVYVSYTRSRSMGATY